MDLERLVKDFLSLVEIKPLPVLALIVVFVVVMLLLAGRAGR